MQVGGPLTARNQAGLKRISAVVFRLPKPFNATWSTKVRGQVGSQGITRG